MNLLKLIARFFLGVLILIYSSYKSLPKILNGDSIIFLIALMTVFVGVLYWLYRSTQSYKGEKKELVDFKWSKSMSIFANSLALLLLIAVIFPDIFHGFEMLLIGLGIGTMIALFVISLIKTKKKA